MRALLIVLCISLLVACANRSNPVPSTVDASLGSDAMRVDADPTCAAWRLESVPITNASSLESLPIHPRRSARLLVEVLHCAADLPAMPSVEVAAAPKRVSLVMNVWRRTPGCQPTTPKSRPVTLSPLPQAGTWTVAWTGGSLPLDVVAAPTGACSPGGTSCERDCDCADREACLSGPSFAGAMQRCAKPCELDRDCGGTGRCDPVVLDDFSFVCHIGAECDAATPCPDGFACNADRCEASFTLSGATRHACSCDSECDAGMRCAFHPGQATGRCEALCLTANDNWCEGPHLCTPGHIEEPRGVCGWIGE